jgi:TonB family protein
LLRAGALLPLTAVGCAHPEVAVKEVESPVADDSNGQFAHFYDGVKAAVGEKWDPQAALKRYDPQGQFAYRTNRYTLLTITLDAEGVVRDIHIEKSSGVGFLDTAAIAAFQKAQPFVTPAPPVALLKDGILRFQFGFLMDFGRGNTPPK